MWQWLIDNKEWVFSGIGVAVVLGLTRVLVTRLSRGRRAPHSLQPVSFGMQVAQPRLDAPSQFEILPIRFLISLNSEIPQVDVWLYAVNHQGSPIVLTSLRVDQLNLSGGPTLESVSLDHDVTISPKNHAEVLCRRALLDAETRAVKASQRRPFTNGSLRIRAEAKLGRKSAAYSRQSVSLIGSVEGLPSPG